MDELWLRLSKAFLDKDEASARKTALRAFGHEEPGDLLWEWIGVSPEQFEIENGVLTISIGGEFGFITIKHRLDENDRLAIIQDTIKQLQKFKTAIEAVK